MALPSLDLTNLPMILAGPVLRRVEQSSVTVWFASQKAFTEVTLTVTDNGSTVATVASPVATHPIGKNLHIGVVTARTPSGSSLQPNKIYLYSMTFDGAAFDAPNIITTAGGNGAIDAIAYLPDFDLPSFSLPAADISDVRVLHGSCRKPHAESIDALQIVDHLIRTSVTDPVGRPQQLYFTGDQIYADDVAMGLLPLLTDAGETLLDAGTDESFPGTQDIPGPGARQPFVTGFGFTSTAADSHLLTFGEFCAMYLFGWSDVLWPATLPSYDDVFPGEATVHNVKLGKATTVATKKKKKFDSQMSWVGAFQSSLPRVRRALANVATYMIFDDHEISDDWYMNRDWANQVFSQPIGLQVIQNGLVAYSLFQGIGNDPDYYLNNSAFDAMLTAVPDWVDGGCQFNAGGSTTAIAAALPVPLGPLGSAEVIQASRPVRWHFAIGWAAHRLVALDTRTWRGYPQSAPTTAVLLSDTGRTTEMADFAALLGTAPALTADGLYLVIAPSPVLGVTYIDNILENGVFGLDFVKELFGLATSSSIAFDRDREILRLNAPAYDGTLSNLADLSAPQPGLVLLSGDVHFGYGGKIEYWQPNDATAPRTVMAQVVSSALKNQDGETSYWHLQSTGHVHRAGFSPVFASTSVPAPILRLAWELTPAETGAPSQQVPIGVMTALAGTTPGIAYANVDGALGVIEDVDDQLQFVQSYSVTRPPDFLTRTSLIASTSTVTRPSTITPVGDGSGGPVAALQAHLDAGKNHFEVFFNVDAPGQQAVGLNNIGSLSFKSSPATVVQELWWWLADPKTLLAALADDDPSGPLQGDLAPQAYTKEEIPLAAVDPPPTGTLK